jgi:hypothetical protein
MARSPSTQQTDHSTGALPEQEHGFMEDLKPEQALALIGMGLMRKLSENGDSLPWLWNAEDESTTTDLPSLRQRLELVDLALRTTAPLTTAEVAHLMGARPGAPVVERGGLVARRQSRNVWILSRSSSEAESGVRHFQETPRRRF